MIKRKKMKTLVIYYSMDGSTRFIAEAIAKDTEADLVELKVKGGKRKKGFLKYVIGGFGAILNRKPTLEPLSRDVHDYDMLFIGTPVWAGRYAPAIGSFLSQEGFSGKRIALFCCCNSSKGMSLANMRKELGRGNDIVGEEEFPNVPDSRERSAEKAKRWARSLVY